MNILLVGATGQIGFALAGALVRAGHSLTVLVRSRRLSFPPQVRVLEAAEFTQAVFIDALQGMDCAVYSVGLPEQFQADVGIFERVNRDLCGVFLDALGASSVRRLVYVSTYEIFEARDGQILESNPIADTSRMTPYFRAMTEAYQMVTAFAGRTGVALTTIHPAAVYGGLDTSEGVTHVIENLLRWRIWKLPVILACRFPLVHVDSLSAAIVSSTEHEGAFIVSDGMSSLRELARAVRGQARSWVPPQFPVPLVYASVIAMETLARAVGIRPILAKVQLDFLTSGLEPVAQHAQRTLAWSPLALETGIKAYLASRRPS